MKTLTRWLTYAVSFLLILSTNLKVNAQARGNMFQGDGTNDKVDVGDVSPLSFEKDATFTFEAWFKAVNSTTGSFVTKGQISPSFTQGYGLFFANRQILFTLNNTAITNQLAVQTIAQFNLNEWYHVACTYDGSSTPSGIKIYLNGVLQATTTLFNSLSASIITTEPVYLGASLEGNLDEVRIWNIIRTQDEIRENIHLTSLGTEPGLIAYYQFNDTPINTALIPIIENINGLDGVLVDNGVLKPSEIPVAKGTFVRQSVNSIGNSTFNNLNINFTTISAPVAGDEFIVYELNDTPYNNTLGNVAGVNATTSNFWLIRQFGIQTFIVDQMEFTLRNSNTISSDDETTPSNLKLYKRSDNDFSTSWTLVGSATSANNTTKKIIFNTGSMTSFSQFIPSGTNTSSLPITLLNFESKRIDNQTVKLYWQTAQELNNKGFEIEQSTDNQLFSKIGFVDGAINSNSVRNYQFTIASPESAYYRLKQIDMDGKYVYSATRYVEGLKANNLVQKLYPNPTQNHQLNLLLNTETAQLTISNLLGQIKFEGKIKKNGTLDVNTLSKGAYIFRFTEGNKTEIKRVIIE